MNVVVKFVMQATAGAMLGIALAKAMEILEEKARLYKLHRDLQEMQEAQAFEDALYPEEEH